MDIKALAELKDTSALRAALMKDPGLANRGVCLSGNDKRTAHPLHRICDAVFEKGTTVEEAIEMAKILLEFGANIDGDLLKGESQTPLIAAASLHAEELAIFYINNGAKVNCINTTFDGETALHWAAYCGRDKLTEKLIQAGADINLADASYGGTPLAWAIHTLKTGNDFNRHNQLACIKLLLQAGADINALDKGSRDYLYILATDDAQLKALFP